MTTIYLSSTFSDLISQREAVYHALRQMRYDVIAMEDYIATDMRPLEKCLQDVATCDVYGGLFAWRYGYVPPEGNPEHKSITELEYRKASSSSKSCLIFLLDEDVPWPPMLMDAVRGEGNLGKSISALRQELKQETNVSFFKTPEHLAGLVGPAIHLFEQDRQLKNSQLQKLENQKVFISYSRIDQEFVNKLIQSLDEVGIEYFLDRKDIQWGDQITKKVQQGLSECSSVVVVISPASLQSQWVPFEIGHAVGEGKKILPLLIHPSLQVPLYLRDFLHMSDIEEVKQYFQLALKSKS